MRFLVIALHLAVGIVGCTSHDPGDNYAWCVQRCLDTGDSETLEACLAVCEQAR